MSAPPEVPEVERLRQRVADLERRELLMQAERIAPGVVIADGASAAEVRACAVRHRHGIAAIDGAGEDEIRGMFRALVILAGGDPVRRALMHRDLRH